MMRPLSRADSFSSASFISSSRWPGFARTKYRALIRKRLFPVRVEGTLPAPGTTILDGSDEVGEVRSGVDGRALAMLRLDAIGPGHTLTAGAARLVPEKPGWMRLAEPANP